MPRLEYLVLADYVRQDADTTTHIMGAGIDTFTIPEGRLPVTVPVGVVALISFDSRDQVGTEHEVSLVFHGPDDTDLLRLTQRFQTPAPAPGTPDHWRTKANLIFRGLLLPLPSYADDYRLEVVMDDDPTRSQSIDVRVVPPGPMQD
jgi:hypothetical protein